MTVELNYDQAFPSKWLKASDLEPNQTTIATVEDVTYEPVGQDKEMAIVLRFTEVNEKGLILNKTNAMTLSSLFGKDPNAAIGKKIGLNVVEVAYAGKMVDAIRISNKIPQVRGPVFSKEN